MTPCPWCRTSFPPSGRRRFCSDACKQAAWRARRATPTPAEALPVGPDATIYQCPSCEARYLGTRRCEDCNLFCRRIGPGGPCPHCDELVARSDLSG